MGAGQGGGAPAAARGGRASRRSTTVAAPMVQLVVRSHERGCCLAISNCARPDHEQDAGGAEICCRPDRRPGAAKRRSTAPRHAACGGPIPSSRARPSPYQLYDVARCPAQSHALGPTSGSIRGRHCSAEPRPRTGSQAARAAAHRGRPRGGPALCRVEQRVDAAVRRRRPLGHVLSKLRARCEGPAAELFASGGRHCDCDVPEVRHDVDAAGGDAAAGAGGEGARAAANFAGAVARAEPRDADRHARLRAAGGVAEAGTRCGQARLQDARGRGARAVAGRGDGGGHSERGGRDRRHAQSEGRGGELLPPRPGHRPIQVYRRLGTLLARHLSARPGRLWRLLELARHLVARAGEAASRPAAVDQLRRDAGRPARRRPPHRRLCRRPRHGGGGEGGRRWRVVWNHAQGLVRAGAGAAAADWGGDQEESRAAGQERCLARGDVGGGQRRD
mmetsp:Transcript_46787/g.151934  ORF Transcript_46787/g.151934 Transcript_46787/m.151934 type:complete len:448 (-) Transcript_46787:115-1458(-)